MAVGVQLGAVFSAVVLGTDPTLAQYPSWSVELARAQASCAATRDERAVISIAPSWDLVGWRLPLRCRDLVG